MNAAHVIKGINEALLLLFPTRTVYVKAQPQEFKRPSFAIDCTAQDWTPATRHMSIYTATVDITLFGVLDANNQVDPHEMTKEQAEIIHMLAITPIPIDDQLVLATSVKAKGVEGDRAFIAVTAEIFVDGQSPEGPLIQTVKIKPNQEENRNGITTSKYHI